jgi:UrcA family protein
MSTQSKIFALAAALSILAGAAAHAEQVTQSQQVSYADLNLSTKAGMQTLMSRISGAAKDVCGPAPEVREKDRGYQACVNAAVDGALAAVIRSAGTRQLAVNIQRQHGG